MEAIKELEKFDLLFETEHSAGLNGLDWLIDCYKADYERDCKLHGVQSNEIDILRYIFLKGYYFDKS